MSCGHPTLCFLWDFFVVCFCYKTYEFKLINYFRYGYVENLDNSNQNIYNLTLDGSFKNCVNSVVCMQGQHGEWRSLGTLVSAKYYIDGKSNYYRFYSCVS